jgi:hypothetical protein
VLFFPLLFPLQFTNWLALRVAPLPKWPRDLTDMHNADVAAAGAQESASARRKPVIRVNGEIVDGPSSGVN